MGGSSILAKPSPMGIAGISQGMGFRPFKVLRQGGTAGYEQKSEQGEKMIILVKLDTESPLLLVLISMHGSKQ
jgi:hypothetical protein